MDEEITVISWVEKSQMCGRPLIAHVWMRSDPPTIARKTNFLGDHHIIDSNSHQITNNSWFHVLVMEQPRPFTFGPLINRLLAPDLSKPKGQDSGLQKDQFTCNQPVPKGTFEMPKWKPKKRMSMETFQSEHMPPVTDEAKKSDIQSTIESCEEAWRAGSWVDFVTVWNFQTFAGLPSEADWKEEFGKNTGD